VATRIARACDLLGIEPIFGVSQADREATYTRGREVVVLGPARAAESYLDPLRVVQAAVQTDCAALHPGWGFLAENAAFASLCQAHGVTFIGPPPAVMHRLCAKTPAKRTMGAAGLHLIPGSDGVLHDVAHACRVADEIGYPVLLKAESGGGGRGMRLATSRDEMADAFAQASGEAAAAFGDDRLYLEKQVTRSRHIEIQLMADRYGKVVHIGERDCSIQRKHQKLIEESPAPTLDPEELESALAAAVHAAAAVGYVGAGTMEFLLDETGTLRFMEMNARLQVEHSVSEMRSGRDLVTEQIRIAAGNRLSFSQQDVVLEGSAIECRINAEDPAKKFRPSPGRIEHWSSPKGAEGQVRVDTHVESGTVISPFYDSLLCKVITRGRDREAACERLIVALEELECRGVPTTVPMHLAILRSPDFRHNRYDTGEIPGWPQA